MESYLINNIEMINYRLIYRDELTNQNIDKFISVTIEISNLLQSLSNEEQTKKYMSVFKDRLNIYYLRSLS
jgi:hypothetical protein